MGEAKGSKKAGRNKRQRDGAMSAFVRGMIDFNAYQKRNGIKPVGLKRTTKKGGEKE
jgi:hypothetical protein